MYGWRARIGRISPSPETVGAAEWGRSMPEGVCFIETRTLIRDVTVSGLSEMVKQVERAARELASAEVDLILQAGTAAAFFRGIGYDAELIKRIREATGVQATTTLTAVIAALNQLRIHKLAIATSYLPEIDAKLVDVLKESGLNVCSIRGMGLQRSIDMGKVFPEATYRLAREAVQAAPEADGILISCGNLRTFEIIDTLEADTGLPVVTSNQAALWQALRMLEIKDKLPGLGRLLTGC